MLRIRMLSGEEVTSMAVEDAISVREVKRRLHQRGLPPRFRLRLFLDGASLDDSDARETR